MGKKLLATICLSSILIGYFDTKFNYFAPVAYAEETHKNIDHLVDFKAYIVCDISNAEEISQVMDSLELAGLMGAFYVTPEELKNYPQKQVVSQIQKEEQGDSVAKFESTRTSVAEFPAQNFNFPKTTEAQIDSVVKRENEDVKLVDNKVKDSSENVNTNLVERPHSAKESLIVNDAGEIIPLKYPGTMATASDVPDWSVVSLVKLSDYGFLAPDDVREIQSTPERDLIAKLILRAYHKNVNTYNQNYYDAKFEIDKLMYEYDNELRNLGYGAGAYSHYAKIPFDNSLKIGGELRYNYTDNSGDKPYDFFDSRLRLRLYAEQPLNKDWTVHAMLESEKSWFLDRYDGKVSLERIYVSGKYKDLYIKGGRFSELYADGNVYDGEITGVSVAGGNLVKVKADVGELRENEKGAAVVATYSEPDYDAAAGVYSFDNVKGYGYNTIVSLGGKYYWKDLGLSAIYLKSSKSDIGGASDAYVLGLGYGRNRSWVPGTFEIFAKYYDQAATTYMGHTMVGLADSMNGFKGYGAGMYYTVAENLVYGLEYYNLKDKYTGLRGRTLWNHVSYYF